MRGTEFGELSAFMAVAEQRNFTRAAKQLGISPATLSETIRNLEERLGIRLLNRTTRSVAPTEAGEKLLGRLRPVIDDYEAAIDSLNEFRDKPAGLVRLTVAPPAAQSVLAPLLAKFLAQYPDIKLEISVDSANVDIVAQQFDAGIRSSDRIDRDMIAVKITDEWRSAVVGTPAYLARRGTPKTPEELAEHNCIRLRLSNGALLPWRFQKDGKSIEISVSGSLILNETSLMAPAVQDGVGLVQLPRAYLVTAIAQGRVVSLLEEWQPSSAPFAIYYSSRRQMPAALQALIDFLRKNQRGSR
ncbi:MAG TPA: LysR family transcriptional regulator [Stellaceae bacterium]|jgi:DNA-binding transcriptional LysR family regulator|nr:LysR family transcriptional regulator [Stellaceae bacterium]